MSAPLTELPTIQEVAALAWQTSVGVKSGEVKNCDADQILNGIGKTLNAAKQHSLDQLLRMKTNGEFVPLLASETAARGITPLLPASKEAAA